MRVEDLLATLYQQPETLVFADVLATIEAEFDFTPTAFTNGNLSNAATENQGSCKVFSFAHQAGLSQANTLALFAEHYRDVLANPDGEAHQNIRQFMQHGWQQVSFASTPLVKK